MKSDSTCPIEKKTIVEITTTHKEEHTKKIIVPTPPPPPSPPSPSQKLIKSKKSNSLIKKLNSKEKFEIGEEEDQEIIEDNNKFDGDDDDNNKEKLKDNKDFYVEVITTPIASTSGVNNNNNKYNNNNSSSSDNSDDTNKNIDGDNIDNNNELDKTISDTNLIEASWKSAENLIKDNKNLIKSTLINIENNQLYTTTIDKINITERTKSLENLKGMPAYGDLIIDDTTIPSMSNTNKTNKQQKDHLYKVIVIGDLGSGKTSIIKRYVHRFFTQHYRATVGVDFALKVINWDENTLIRLQLWDIAGQERYGNMTRVYYKEAVGAFIVFDVTRVTTFESVSKWKSDLDSKVQLSDGSPIPCVLLANKCDQPKEGLINNPNKMDDYCKDNNFLAWFETSAKDNINIDEAAKALVTQILENDTLTNNKNNRDIEKISLSKYNNGEKNSKNCSC